MALTEAAASVAARAFFYPSLAWNIARSKLQDTWHWWDEITEGIVLGAIPFYSDIDSLKKLGVTAVVTLNEEFEVFITSEQYKEHGLDHLHIPTVDFLFAPPTEDLHRGAGFIYENSQHGRKTYVHCKAGRGRSTTLVLCYLIKYKAYTPEQAYTFVRQKRPQVYLAQGQWESVCTFYVSCHPDEDLDPADFPYPKFLPGPDQVEGEGATRASCCEDPVSSSCTDDPASASNSELNGLKEVTEMSDTNLEDGTRAEGQPQQKSPTCSLPTLVSHAAEALEVCSIQGFPESGVMKTIPSSGSDDQQQPQHSATAAILIPKTKTKTEDPDKFRSTSSSLSMEPSGSLPGYVKIVAYRRPGRKGSTSCTSPPVSSASLASEAQRENSLPLMRSGFADAANEDDDWASI